MIDAALIQENYAQMSDEQLIHLAKTEGGSLTGAALSILQGEFVHRRLDISIFETIDDNRTSLQNDRAQTDRLNISGEFNRSLWSYAFEEKKEGVADDEISRGLIEQGLNEEQAILMIKTLESKAKENMERHHSRMLLGAIMFLGGCTITLLTFTNAKLGGTYIIAWGAILFGAIRFVSAVNSKEKFKTILENIELEHGSKSPDP
jgi:hypothetical protein